MKKTILFLVFTLTTFSSFACREALQLKTFPIGILDDKIIAMDVIIKRSDPRVRINKEKYKWFLTTYISEYNREGELILVKEMDCIEFLKDDYEDELKELFQNTLDSTKKTYKGLEKLQPKYISFCNYSGNCELLKKTFEKENFYLKYKKKKYSVHLDNFLNFDKVINTYEGHYELSSIRVFEAGDVQIVLGHLGKGHELGLGWLTNDPNKKSEKEGDVVIYVKEEKRDLDFDSIENSIYTEDLLHHGFGFDAIFVVK
ncbi:hypothetical protein [Aureivirga sp. CE67]|uniref:hypothetical protein n=1 Tax=Aureivirga sp. CE67 TaxID=1788983 RepID=UPI0018CA85BE|nr:hypothetical protein [Aureivirga sp. CE67]